MQDIWKSLLKNAGENTGHVIARVISTWGSAPRRAGSALLISPDMVLTGSVSGGCIESAVAQEAEKVRATGIPKLATYGVADETAWSVGLTCGGSVSVYIEPFRMTPEENQIWETIENFRQQKKSCTLITRLSPSHASCLINSDGIATKTEETLPPQIIEEAKRISHLELCKKIETENGIYFLQAFPLPAKLIIVGAGHIAVPLSNFAAELGFSITVIDPRTAFLNVTAFGKHTVELLNIQPKKFFAEFQDYENLYVALLSHDPKIDDPVYPFLFKNNVPYIGALGSRKTNKKRKQRLLEAGFDESQINRISSPIGVPINSVTAGEIALSIIAQIVQLKNSPQNKIASEKF